MLAVGYAAQNSQFDTVSRTVSLVFSYDWLKVIGGAGTIDREEHVGELTDSCEEFMSEILERQPQPTIGLLIRTWRSLKDALVGPVPGHIAVCEFDCEESECNPNWRTCQTRLHASEPGSIGRGLPLSE